MTDPAHPLFGQRFPIRSVSSPLQGAGHVLVAYRDYMVLRIPTEATNLAEPRPASKTKLTRPAIEELVALAVECEVICLPSLSSPPTSSPAKSGTACLPSGNTASAPSSCPSSRR